MKTAKSMSKISGIALLLILSFTLITNCKKKEADPEPTPAPVVLTNTQKLTGKNWRMTAFTVSPGINVGTTTITDIFGQMEACSKDDLMYFNTNNTYTSDEGATKCDPSDPQTITGTWVWNTNETVITITETGSTPESYTIITNDGSTLKISYTYNDNGTIYTYTITFTKA